MAKKRKPRKKTFRNVSIFTLLFLVVAGISGRVWYHYQDADTQYKIRSQAYGAVNAFSDKVGLQRSDLEQVRSLLDLLFPERGITIPADLAGGDVYTLYGLPLSETRLTPIKRTGYIVGYNPKLKVPAWVAYRLHHEDRKKPSERPEGFRPDPMVANPVRSQDYTNSGYSRGHMAPSYAIGLYYGPEAQEETFYMTNIIPQKQELNGGLWKTLEDYIANTYTTNFEEIWVITGPVFKGPEIRTLPGTSIGIPDECFMIIADIEGDEIRLLSFSIPQEPTGALRDYLTTIDAIEATTGLDFFSKLPDHIEEKVESTKPLRLW